MIPFQRAFLMIVLLVLSAAAAADAHLRGDESALLHSGSVTVIFLDPERELDAYLRTQAQLNTPYNGGAVGAIVGGAIEAHRVNEFVEAMQPYADVIGKQHFTDQEYALLHGVLGAQPPMQKAEWQRLPSGTDRRHVMGMMKGLPTQAIVLVTPQTSIRDDLDQMLVDYRIELFVKDPYEDYGVKRLRNSEFTQLSPDPAPDTFPPLDYTHSDTDALTVQHLQTFFADGGARLTQYFQGAVPSLRSQITYFFTGVMPAAPTTAAPPAAATHP